MKKWTAAQLQLLKFYWKAHELAEGDYYEKKTEIEKRMQEELGIPDLEFFINEWGVVRGIGNQYAEQKHKYKLVQGEELE